MQKQLLQEITQQILTTSDRLSEITQGKILNTFFSDLVAANASVLNSQPEVVVKGGVALSPQGAMDCLKEYYRTARFIKGVYAAIHDLFVVYPEQQINILYAGCGPYAPLIYPVLSLLPENSVSVTLLDISDYSIASAKSIGEVLGLSSFIHKAIVDDATTYKKEEGEKIHLLISETMFRALIREPQVAIIANLAPQLEENGLMIPQAVTIEAGYSFFGYEPFYQFDNRLNTEEGIEVALPERKITGTVLEINKAQNFSDVRALSSIYYTDWYNVPAEVYPTTPDLCLFTTVQVYKDNILESTTSSITNPHCITAIVHIQGNNLFRLVYYFDDIPAWKLELK